MPKVWTDNQSLAITTLNADVCVAAGAGSGKTGVLVERFLRIVRESADGSLPREAQAGVGEILVITFTEKATKEMKSRIVEELTHAGLREQRREVETAYISTIHGFCSRLLKENPFEAGVDPEYTVLDENESHRMLHTAFETVIEQAFETRNEEITELVAAAQDERVFGSDLQDPLSSLEMSLKSVLNAIRGVGWRQEEFARTLLGGEAAVIGSLRSPVHTAINHVIHEVRAGRVALAELKTGVMGTLESVRRDVLERSADLDDLSNGVSWERTLHVVSQLQEIVKAALRGSKARVYGGDAEIAAQQIFERIHAAAASAKDIYQLNVDSEEQSDTLCFRFMRLLSSVWDVYNGLKRREGVLDNDDLQSEAVNLLKSYPGVLRRYRRRFQYLMIDEFQDTNPLQMELLELLHPLASGESTARPGNNLFVVGDVQQSIYGFRNADASQFQSMESSFRTGGRGQYVSLAENFRARPELLRFVNYLFEQIWRGGSVPFTALIPGAKHAEKPAASIEFLVTRDTGRQQYIPAEAQALARRIKQIVERGEIKITDHSHPRFGQQAGYGDVAILLRGLTDIERYERAFVEEGVPYFVVGGGRGYYARTEIRDVMNVLTVIDTPLNDVALAATLRSPMVGLDAGTLYALARFAHCGDKKMPLYSAIPRFLVSEDVPDDQMAALREFYEIMEELRKHEDRIPVGRLLDQILARTQYDAKLLLRPSGRRRLANVRKLLQMASAVSVRGVSDFIRRLKEIEKISDREGDAPTEEEAADVVRFLTIHKAKGLEFPIVFVADLGRSLTHPENRLFVCEPKSLAMGCRLGDYQTAAYRTITEEKRRGDREEANRLLYVALTRAREHLILCGATQARARETWASIVFGHMAVTQPEQSETRIGPGGIKMRLTAMAALNGGTGIS